MQPICAVCGQNPEGDVVFCTLCEGVYHRDCWLFFGACARYACGGVAFADGMPAAPLDTEITIDEAWQEPPPRVAPARPGDAPQVQLGLVTERTSYGQALTLLNAHRIKYRVHQPGPAGGGPFLAWVYVPYESYGHARSLVEDQQIAMEFTPLARRQDLVNYPWALAACVAAMVAAPAHVAPLAVVALCCVAGRDVKDGVVGAVRRVLVKRPPLLPPGKE